jgi:hypothetical protein
MFGLDHYIPVLRWKRGEQVALAWLDTADRDAITPLIEITPDDYSPDDPDAAGNLAARLPRLTAALETARGSRRTFVDFGFLATGVKMPTGQQPITQFFSLLEGGGTNAVPVIGLTRSVEYQLAARTIAARTHELALRLTLDDLRQPTLHRDIDGLLGRQGLPPDHVHLLIDLAVVGNSPPSFGYVCDRIPTPSRWLTFTVIAGSFPTNLSHLSVGTHLVPRLEWRHWRNQALMNRRLSRFPTFGDYTTQHGIYQVPPPGANVSASARYTSDEDWLVMRGEGLRSKGSPGYAQYPAIAALLCDQKEYRGPDFSSGDHYIWQIASHELATTGNPETWLRAGINHHLVAVIRQLAATMAGISPS